MTQLQVARAILPRAFYDRDTLCVAQELLGHRLVRIWHGQRVSGRIVETEAYVGSSDTACHAARGRTDRNAVMFGPPGHAYVYFIYGMYHCLNVVTEAEGFPAAVLIRALEPLEGLEVMRENRGGRPDRELTAGPGRLCQALGIDRRFNGVDLCEPGLLFIEEGEPPSSVAAGPRIGIRAETKDMAAPWRFFLPDSSFVSR